MEIGAHNLTLLKIPSRSVSMRMLAKDRNSGVQLGQELKLSWNLTVR